MATHYHLLVANLVSRKLYCSRKPLSLLSGFQQHLLSDERLLVNPWHNNANFITLDLVLWIILY